jgi:hypothetical protein
MKIKYLFAFSMAVAALCLPRTGQAQSCENGTCETWAVYDSSSNAIVGGSYYENFYSSIANVNVYLWDPNNNQTYLGGAVNDSYVEVDFSYTPQMGGTYTIAGYNYYMLEDNPWAPDGYSSTTVDASPPQSQPPQIASCQGPASWVVGWNSIGCLGSDLSDVSVGWSGNGGTNFLESSNATISQDGTQADVNVELDALTYGAGWITISDGDAGYSVEVPETEPQTGCPTSIAIANNGITPLPLQAGLSNNFPTYLTGVGILATMLVGPYAPLLNGAQVSEVLTQTQNTCPGNFPTACGSPSTFTVGPPAPTGTTFGTPFPALQDNEFFDEHATIGIYDLLAGTGNGSSCQITCAQTYYSCGQPIGSFTIQRTFTHSAINGTSVTLVGVTKQ